MDEIGLASHVTLLLLATHPGVRHDTIDSLPR